MQPSITFKLRCFTENNPLDIVSDNYLGISAVFLYQIASQREIYTPLHVCKRYIEIQRLS